MSEIHTEKGTALQKEAIGNTKRRRKRPWRKRKKRDFSNKDWLMVCNRRRDRKKQGKCDSDYSTRLERKTKQKRFYLLKEHRRGTEKLIDKMPSSVETKCEN